MSDTSTPPAGWPDVCQPGQNYIPPPSCNSVPEGDSLSLILLAGAVAVIIARRGKKK